MAFIAPWELVFSDMGGVLSSISGWKLLFYSIDSLPQDLPDLSRNWWFYLPELFILISLLLAGGYALLNLAWALALARYKKRTWWQFGLIGVGISTLLLFHKTYTPFMSQLAWGYWFASGAWFSSLSLEILEAELPRVRRWSIMNTLLLVVALASPWELQSLENQTTSGWRVIMRAASRTFKPTFILSDRSFFFCLIALGGLGLSLYALLNLLQALQGDRYRERWQVLTLLSGFLGGAIVFEAVDLGFASLLWGYWLAGGGLLSSYLLEAVTQGRSPHSDTANLATEST
jgi:hypothetical protein